MIRHIITSILTFLLVVFLISPGSAYFNPSLLNEAEQAAKNGDNNLAEKKYMAALESIPDKNRMKDLVRYRLGLIQLKSGKYQEALENIKAYYTQKPELPAVAINYIRALYLNKRYDEAIEINEKLMALYKGLEPFARYNSGVIKITSGRVDEGLKVLNDVAGKYPNSPVSEKSIEIMNVFTKEAGTVSGTEVPGRPTRQKPWGLSFALGTEYDTNVALIPSNQPRPTDISSTNDLRFTFSSNGMYEFVNTGNNIFGISANFYGGKQAKDNMLDVISTGVGLYYKHNIKNRYQLRILPFASKTWLDYSGLSWNYGTVLGASWQPLLWTWTDVDYVFTKTSFLTTPQYPQENRSGNSHTVTARQNFSFPSLLIDKKNSFFSAWYYHNNYNADGSSYSSHSDGFGVLAQQEFPIGFNILLSYSFIKSNFNNPNIRSATNQKRDDTNNTISLTLFKNLDFIYKNLSCYFGYRWYKNSSNIQNYYSYNSSSYSSGLNIAF